MAVMAYGRNTECEVQGQPKSESSRPFLSGLRKGMHAAHEVNGPRFADAILTTEELLALLPANSEHDS